MFSTPDPFAELARKGRIYFRSGLVQLSRDQERFTADLIEKLELAPDGQQAVPAGNGTFARTIEGSSENAEHRYEFTQTFSHGQLTYDLSLTVSFAVENGVARSPIASLNDKATSYDFSKDGFAVYVGGKLSSEDHWTGYMTCDYDGFLKRKVTVVAANGDRLEFSTRTLHPPCAAGMGCAGGIDWGALVRTRFERGQTVREVDDFFHLIYTAVHHDGGQKYIAIFGQPLGEVHGVAVLSEDPTRGGVDYLDAQLNVIATEEITERESQPE
jgi:hypothetical protein